jgi:hypothetical protein
MGWSAWKILPVLKHKVLTMPDWRTPDGWRNLDRDATYAIACALLRERDEARTDNATLRGLLREALVVMDAPGGLMGRYAHAPLVKLIRAAALEGKP